MTRLRPLRPVAYGLAGAAGTALACCSTVPYLLLGVFW